ncbi:hypothetical protein SUDANB58_03292 [Streptomyces sp. enrichment culture]|uniref:DUF3558 domain-containing protein n=1 Tax=Streptomyces sp. enrichment culture TaxID=1795815 RepID=UPI003F553D5D
MQRKAYVPGVAALLAAVLAGCTGGSGDGGTTDDANPGGTGRTTAAAEPGKYHTLPEPCGAISRGTLDSLLPGIEEIADDEQREKAYAGEATLTFDTDRKVGCRWKVESASAVDRLLVDFERVVSYDSAVSDDSEAERLFARKEDAADLPEPSGSASASASASESASGSGTTPSAAAGTARPSTPDPSASSGSPGSSASSAPASGSASAAPPPGDATADLRSRLLDGLGDEAFLDDELSSGSAAEQRTVTVAFRTSNVIVTIEYAQQPTTVGTVPDSGEMQDRARKLASRLADALSG